MNSSFKTMIATLALIASTSLASCAGPIDKTTAPTKNLGFLVTVEAKPGQESNAAKLFADAVDLAEKEEGTLTWYAFRIDETKFGIFDTFHDENARQAHLNGKIAEELVGNAPQLFVDGPSIKPVQVLANKSQR